MEELANIMHSINIGEVRIKMAECMVAGCMLCGEASPMIAILVWPNYDYSSYD